MAITLGKRPMVEHTAGVNRRPHRPLVEICPAFWMRVPVTSVPVSSSRMMYLRHADTTYCACNSLNRAVDVSACHNM
jgi:hypothetical protein